VSTLLVTGWKLWSSHAATRVWADFKDVGVGRYVRRVVCGGEEREGRVKGVSVLVLPVEVKTEDGKMVVGWAGIGGPPRRNLKCSRDVDQGVWAWAWISVTALVRSMPNVAKCTCALAPSTSLRLRQLSATFLRITAYKR
jgi:hypothetical protein